MQASFLYPANSRAQILTALEHLDPLLPGQAPILDFVHHNTLHGFQHLPFEKALAEYEALTGIYAYLPEEKNRLHYQQGRITQSDLHTALSKSPHLKMEQTVCLLKDRVITRYDIYTLALLYELEGLSISQLNWQMNESGALIAPQTDLPASVRNCLCPNGTNQEHIIKPLWEGLVSKLDLNPAGLHPETMLDLSLDQAEEWLSAYQGIQQHKPSLPHDDCTTLDDLLSQVGDSITLRGFILKLSGVDIMDSVRPQLIRICASTLDEGVAAWKMSDTQPLGLYASWRASISYDANPFLHELPDWQQIICDLPEDAIDTIILQLTQLEIPPQKWAGYLQKLALELPGWSGLINWHQHHPHYQTTQTVTPKLADYLAVRLTLDRLWLNQICMDFWNIEAKLSTLKSYFRKNLSEFAVRNNLYQGNLPEYLTQLAESLTTQADSERNNKVEWQPLADLIWTWQCSPMADNNKNLSAHNSGWRLFRLFQHLGLDATHLEILSKENLQAMLTLLDEFNVTERSKVWLYAYEINYRDHFFQVLSANHNRGRWAVRNSRPASQLIFCMDDREEGFRRHLEEFNPAIETLGAAGFFGVAMNYKGLDDTKVTALCPVVITPSHEVHETPRIDSKKSFRRYHLGRQLNQAISNWLHHGFRRNLLVSHPLIDATAPLMLLGLLAKSLLPRHQYNLLSRLSKWMTPKINTELNFIALDLTTLATPERPKLGFTDNEQATRVAGLLRNTGLTSGFSELVVLMGHGSISQNNPHLAAYDCGACSGRHGGPNARVFAAMANRPETRTLLAQQGINIPNDTWFIGAEHNTCNEDISWFDLTDLPQERLSAFELLQQALKHAQRMSAHERCRRLASAPRNPTPYEALTHIQERATDFSQTRPELGHATNAAALIGKRSLTQGAFFDRRLFLISYDAAQDPEGSILEGILLAVGPVGAGINLEYYFSTVNNERLGCGSKAPHNITGFFGVMEGASSDLRTGLPQQMVEIHEAMRLQIVVEAKTSVLERIYADQESLRELIAGGWIHLSTKDPESGAIHIFEPGTGFVHWQAKIKDIPMRNNSSDCYRDHTLPVPPMLINQPTVSNV